MRTLLGFLSRQMTGRWVAILAVFVVVCITNQAGGGEVKLTASDAAVCGFGCSVSISGQYALVGALYDEEDPNEIGSAYVFARGDGIWTQEAQLVASDAAGRDMFGKSVSISGETAVVGAYGDDDNAGSSGAAYVFVCDGRSWVQEAKLLASDGASGDWLGFSVSASGHLVIVGGRFSESAYVFQREATNWTQQAKLVADDGVARGCFGISVSISGETAIVGAYADDHGEDGDGSAYVFQREGTRWVQQAKLVANDTAAVKGFGLSVSISGDIAIVGSYGSSDHGRGSGAAYVFVRQGEIWTQEAKLLAREPAEDEYFAWCVSISGNAVIVGARSDDQAGFESGAAYIFQRDGADWTERAKFVASDPGVASYFGYSVCVSADYAIVGARYHGDDGISTGAAYIYHPLPGTSTVVEEKPSATTATRFSLAQNVPNPFNPVTRIAYDLREASEVRLGVYTLTGQHVATLVSGPHKAGHYETVWDATPLASGIYVYRLQAGGSVQTGRAVLLR